MHARLSWNKLEDLFLLSSDNHLHWPRPLLLSFIQLSFLTDIKQEQRTSDVSPAPALLRVSSLREKQEGSVLW